MVSLSFLAVDRVETVVLLARPSGSTREKNKIFGDRNLESVNINFYSNI